MSQLPESELAVSTADFDDDDFLDLADEFGHVVDSEPGCFQGFVDMGLDQFVAYSRALVREARLNDQPEFEIQNSIDYALACAALETLEQQLLRKYEGDVWDKNCRYVRHFNELFAMIRKYEKRVASSVYL
jgi:hypothetical protein